jgi:hypothetical protein
VRREARRSLAHGGHVAEDGIEVMLSMYLSIFSLTALAHAASLQAHASFLSEARPPPLSLLQAANERARVAAAMIFSMLQTPKRWGCACHMRAPGRCCRPGGAVSQGRAQPA